MVSELPAQNTNQALLVCQSIPYWPTYNQVSSHNTSKIISLKAVMEIELP